MVVYDNQARKQGGVHGVHSHPPTGPKGPYFDTQYPSYGVQSVKLKFQT